MKAQQRGDHGSPSLSSLPGSASFVPLLAAGWVYYAAFLAPLDPDPLKHGKVLDSIAVLVVLGASVCSQFRSRWRELITPA